MQQLVANQVVTFWHVSYIVTPYILFLVTFSFLGKAIPTPPTTLIATLQIWS
jgi:hypothetical protein